MADQEKMLAQKLRDYIDTVRETAGVEAKRLQLMDLVLVHQLKALHQNNLVRRDNDAGPTMQFRCAPVRQNWEQLPLSGRLYYH